MKPASRTRSARGRTVLDWDIVLGIAGLTVFFSLLALAGQADYLAFHSAIEFFVAAVALAVFAISWHTRNLVDDDFLTVLGICFLFDAGVIVLHALTYDGMSVVAQATPTMGSQFWVIARGLLAAGLVVSPAFIGRRMKRPELALVLFGAPVVIALLAVFAGAFPVTFVPGSGLTPFKVRVEWVIVAAMASGWGLLWRKRDRLEHGVFVDLTIAIACMILAETFFSVYTSLTDSFNVLGHIFHLLSFYFVYRALVARSLEDPFAVLFRQLRQREDELRDENHYSEGLNRITSEISSWLSVDDILSHSVSSAARIAGADGAIVSLHGDDGRLGVRYVYGDQLRDAHGMVFDREQAPGVFEAAESREPVIIADAESDLRAGIAAEQFGANSLLAIPLTVHGEVLGVMSLHWCRPSSNVTSPRLLLFARKLGAALSLALANAQLYEGEHRVAETLQNAMAASVETVSGVEIGSVYRSAPGIGSIGGDFYDVFDLPSGRVAFLLGDVSGKGIEAASTNALARSTVRALAYRSEDPGRVLGGANDALLRQLADSEFVTAAFGVLDPATRSVEMALAGHPEPMVSGDADVSRGTPHNPPLAVLEGERFAAWQFTLCSGDALVLFSDGVCEARRGHELFGTERVRELLDSCVGAPCQEIADRLHAEIERFSEGTIRDDVAILALRPHPE